MPAARAGFSGANSGAICMLRVLMAFPLCLMKLSTCLPAFWVCIHAFLKKNDGYFSVVVCCTFYFNATFSDDHALVEILEKHMIGFIEEVDVPESVFCVGGKPVHLQKRVPVRDCI